MIGPLLLIGSEFKEGFKWVRSQGQEARKQAQSGSWAMSQLKTLKTQTASDSLDRIMKEYIERKWNQTMTSSLRHDWVDFLKKQGVSQSLQDSLLGLLESYDFTRFASSQDASSLDEIIDLAIEWIKEVDQVQVSSGDQS